MGAPVVTLADHCHVDNSPGEPDRRQHTAEAQALEGAGLGAVVSVPMLEPVEFLPLGWVVPPVRVSHGVRQERAEAQASPPVGRWLAVTLAQLV